MVKCATSEANLDVGGMIEAGRYHFAIDSQTLRNYDGRETIEVDLVVLSGTNQAMVNRKHKEFFSLDGKAVGRFFQLAMAAGLTTKDALKAAQDSGAEVEIDETLLPGRTFCGEVRLEEYRGRKAENQGKSFPQLGFRLWSPLSKEAADIPKDPTVMAMLGQQQQQAGQAAGGGSNGAGVNGGGPAATTPAAPASAQRQPQQSQQSQQSPAGDDPWSDL